MELINNHWETDSSALGFYCVNQYSNKINYPKELLIESHFTNLKGKSHSIEKVSHYGPLDLSRLDIENLTQITFDEVIKNMHKVFKEANWGDDLPVLKEHFNKSFKTQEQFNKGLFTIINQDYLPIELIIKPNFYSYFICIISWSNLKVYTFGGD